MSNFASALDTLPKSSIGWVDVLRQQAAEAYKVSGLPTQRVESWKYTSLRPFENGDYNPVAKTSSNPPARVTGIAPHRFIFINGKFASALSQHDLKDGVVVGSIAAFMQDNPQALAAGLGGLGQLDQSLLALNTALFEDGFVLRVPDNQAIAAPIEIVFIGSAATFSNPRILVTMGVNSSATLIERHEGQGAFATNIASEITLKDGAQLRHYRLQEADAAAHVLATGLVHIAQHAHYESFALTTGGRLSRHQISATLAGSGSEVHLNGAHILAGDAHADTTTLIEHAAPHTNSRETYRQVLDDTSRGVFQGKILVKPGAQKTDGFQLNQALLLSPNAEIDAKPELEIYADDVKCSHGATAGRLDEEALFYLRSRGISAEAARALLIEGFIGASIDLITHEAVREFFKAHVARKLEKTA